MTMYVIIIVVSLILNWGVQLAYYFWRKKKDPVVFGGQKTLLDYYTGYIGDGIIVPLMNILIYFIIVRLGMKEGFYGADELGEFIKKQPVGFLFALAIVLDVVTHYVQGKNKMTNWSMPAPFVWNFAGYWHMISFPIQISYLLLFFWIFISHGVPLKNDWPVLAASVGVFSLMGVFVVLFHKDNRIKQTTKVTF